MPPTRQLPGITFRTETPVQVELPRMDVAAFVGFAQRGPLHTPVAVEDYDRFVDIFGGTYPLAWDQETATWQTACLAPAVKAFFTQGGRRCWVVRVASDRAVTHEFPLAGLLQTTGSGYVGVTAAARSPGSWSDALQVRAELQRTPLPFEATAVQPGMDFSLRIGPMPHPGIQAGDLLQLDFTDGLHRVYAVVESSHWRTDEKFLEITANPLRTYWFRRVAATASISLSGTVQTVSPQPPFSAAGTLNVEMNPPTLTLVFHETELPSVPAVPGDWLRLDTADERLWLQLGSSSAEGIQVTAAWFEGADSEGSPLVLAGLMRVQMALRVGEQPGDSRVLTELGFAAPHPRFLGYLPDDATLLGPTVGQSRRPFPDPPPALWEDITAPRFPLTVPLTAGNDEAVVIPLGLEATAPWRGALATDLAPLVRDGLVPDTGDWANFLSDLFLDPSLRNTGQRSLMTEATNRLYLAGQALKGLHAIVPIEEVSVLALPDAAHRGWRRAERATAIPERISAPPIVRDPCAPTGPFAPLATKSEAETVGGGEASPAESPEEREQTGWMLLPPADDEDNGLLTIQLAAAKLAAARGDMVAVLGMPKHYRTPAVLNYQQQLSRQLRLAGETTDSYVALYHPWLVTREDTGALVYTHPAGGICGIIAARSLARGAWVAPANEIIRGTLATLPTVTLEDEFAFYQAGINFIRQGGQGFWVWGGYTQSTDPDLENLNVRRLLILLKRIALTEGQTLVFAPHSPALRRRVKQQFEQHLAQLFARGAFAGRNPSEAYRVVIDERLNSQSSIEQGQLVVELQVAPAQPLTFITVRLRQLESGPIATQEVIRRGR